jgi:MFS family permease
VYHENTSTASLNYIALAVGEVSGTLIGQYGNDRYYRHMKQRNNGKESPQYRVPLMYPGAIFVPIGLFLYGWAGQYHVHWVVPDIGIAIFGFGSIMGTQSTNSYIVDVYTRYSASAMAATTFLRSLTAFTFPLFAPYLYQKLDYGWGNTLIAFLAILIGIPAPLLLARYGPRLRAKSRFAAGGLEELK